ncbi:hypothetical protein IJJ08_00950 [bacterium]|nr:hypothetical protein [bacterium]
MPWEIKSITKAKDSTIQHAFSKGVKQAKNLIFDLRGLSSTQAGKAYLLVIKIFQQFRQARRLMIITKSGTLETYQK